MNLRSLKLLLHSNHLTSKTYYLFWSDSLAYKMLIFCILPFSLLSLFFVLKQLSLNKIELISLNYLLFLIFFLSPPYLSFFSSSLFGFIVVFTIYNNLESIFSHPFSLIFLIFLLFFHNFFLKNKTCSQI